MNATGWLGPTWPWALGVVIATAVAIIVDGWGR